MNRTFVLLAAATLLSSAPVSADLLAEAKALGNVCERANGYLSAFPDAPGEVQAEVNEENKRRKEEYEKIANETGEAVEKIAESKGGEIREKSPGYAC